MPVGNLDLKVEAVLNPHIQFQYPRSKNSTHPKSVFLTGATGLLGAHLLAELLKKTTADIYCLTRSNDLEAAKQRLKNHLQFYALWEETLSSRIIPVVGDLSKPLLGISEQQFSELASQVDVIYHNGALVNFVYPYSTLKKANVSGTQEILKLASMVQTKPVHFVSSLAVFFSKTYSQAEWITETDVPVVDSSFKGGYKQSKWVAEKLVMMAQERGLPATIYRPGRILGDSKHGITGNTDDVLCTLLKACIQLEKYPAASQTKINITPADYVAQAIVYLSQQENSFGKGFHFFNPQPIFWSDLFNEIRSLGYSVEEIDYEQWLGEFEHYIKNHPDEKSYPFLLRFLNSPGNIFSKRPPFDTRQTTEGLAESSIVCPPVDAKLISTYFSYFQSSGYIPAPPST
jgi:thioester reductase-like protein